MKATEEFWAGHFGDEYNKRNVDLIEGNIAFWECVRDCIDESKAQTILELGCGTGQNLEAIRCVFDESVELLGVELNREAAMAAMQFGNIQL